jgi:hypothetical protein
VPKRIFEQGDTVVVGTAAVPAVVVSPDVRFMLTRGPRHPVVGVALRQAGGWWEPGFFLPEDVKRREETPALV